MINEKRAPGCLGYIGDEICPVMWGLLHKPLYVDTYEATTRIQWKVRDPFFFVAQLSNVSFPTGFFVGASQFFGDSAGSPGPRFACGGVGSVITNPS